MNTRYLMLLIFTIGTWIAIPFVGQQPLLLFFFIITLLLIIHTSENHETLKKTTEEQIIKYQSQLNDWEKIKTETLRNHEQSQKHSNHASYILNLAKNTQEEYEQSIKEKRLELNDLELKIKNIENIYDVKSITKSSELILSAQKESKRILLEHRDEEARIRTLYQKLKAEEDSIYEKAKKIEADHFNKAKQKSDAYSQNLLIQTESQLKSMWESAWNERSAEHTWLAVAKTDAWEHFWQSIAKAKAANAPMTRQEILRRLTSEVRQTKIEAQTNKTLVAYYESLFPDLEDLREGAPIAELPLNEAPERVWLTEEEWQSLSNEARSELSLERYLARNKSKWEIGLEYERYCGYHFEQENFHVEYFGATRKLDDLGRDLILRRGSEVVIVQCKNWSAQKNIHEKHVFQTFGTMKAQQLDEPFNQFRCILMTSTTLSDRAKRFAEALNVEIIENFKIPEQYPRIKAVLESRIYHLPFDQNYDAIRPQNCVRFQTPQEAAKHGYRRAYKWSGNGS